MTNRKIMLIVAFLIAALCVRIAVYKYYEAPPSTSEVSVDAQTTAITIMDSYESDESQANQLYLNKYVDVMGTVAKLVEDDKCSVYLSTNSLMGYVIAELSDCTDLEAVSKGSSVTVRGLCSGYLSDVILVRSIVKI